MQTLPIECEEDILDARAVVRDLAGQLNSSIVDKTRLATAVGELARNMIVHADGGEMQVETVSRNERSGIRCLFVDKGPGIPDIEQALRDGFSTTSSLGQGLPGARRLVSEFRVESVVDQGTEVEIVRWL